VEEAKKRDRMNWKEHVMTSPDHLPRRLKELISMAYAECTNEITGREWFPNLPSLRDILMEFKDILCSV
jgi:hypothetical protein